MSRRIDHRCAACGAWHASTRRSRAAIGRPFATCNACGGFVARRPYAEWSPMPPAAKLELALFEFLLAVCTGLLPAVLFGLYGELAGREPSRARLLVVAVAGAALATSVWLVHLTRRIRDSRRRMGDPMYRAKLVEFELSTTAGRERAPARAGPD